MPLDLTGDSAQYEGWNARGFNRWSAGSLKKIIRVSINQNEISAMVVSSMGAATLSWALIMGACARSYVLDVCGLAFSVDSALVLRMCRNGSSAFFGWNDVEDLAGSKSVRWNCKYLFDSRISYFWIEVFLRQRLFRELEIWYLFIKFWQLFSLTKKIVLKFIICYLGCASNHVKTANQFAVKIFSN